MNPSARDNPAVRAAALACCLLLLPTLLGACGQKGDLFIPAPPGAAGEQAADGAR